MVIKDKWKAFAAGEVLSGIEDKDMAAVFDRLVGAGYKEEIQRILNDEGACVWEPFESWNVDSVVDYMENLATRLQQFDNAPD